MNDLVELDEVLVLEIDSVLVLAALLAAAAAIEVLTSGGPLPDNETKIRIRMAFFQSVLLSTKRLPPFMQELNEIQCFF